MQKPTRRGFASFGIAALLVLAPITATAAYADDELAVAEASVEIVAEAPAEVVVEEPAEAVTEAPVEIVADAPVEVVAQAPAVELPAEVVAAAERTSTAPAARAAGYSPVITNSWGAYPPTLTISGSTLTASWAPTASGATYGYYSQLHDFTTRRTVASTYNSASLSFTAELISGHSYQAYYDDRNQGNVAEFTMTPAPNAPAAVTATRLVATTGLALSWAAPSANTASPAKSYSVAKTSGGVTETVTTSNLGYDFTGLTVGATYSFAVTSIAADGQQSTVSSITATMNTIAPTAATTVALARTGGQLTASWGAPSYNGGAAITDYSIVLRAGGAIVKSYAATAAGSLVLDVPAGYETEYTVDVTATNAAGLTSTVTSSNPVFRPAVTPTTPVVTAERLTSSSAYTVTWTESTAGDSPITAYTVTLYNTADDSVISSVRAIPTTRSATVAIPSTITWGDGLRFDVVATAENGLSSATGSYYAGFAAVAPSAVRNLLLTRDGDDLVASWDAPAYDGGIGIMWYYVDLYADGVLAGKFAAYDGDTSLVLSGAAEYSIEYTVKVVPLGDGGIYGPSVESDPVERANFAPTTPTAFGDAFGYKEPLIHASWSFAPQEGSAVQSVTVTLYNADGSIAQQENVSNGVPGTTFSGLTNDTTYSVGVVATNAAGSSTESARTEVRTNAAVPPALTEAEVVADENRNNVTVSLTGTELTAHVDGVAAGEWVFGYAYSTPTPLGWAQVDANGFARWSIAGAGLATGATHTLAVQNNFGASLGFATFAIAADASPAALAHTGSDADTVLLLAAGMLALGAVLMVRRRVRTAL